MIRIAPLLSQLPQFYKHSDSARCAASSCLAGLNIKVDSVQARIAP